MARDWTEEETEMLKSMLAKGFYHSEIAKRLGRTLKSVRGKMFRLTLTAQRKAELKQRERERYAAITPRGEYLNEDVADPRPSEGILLERAVRLSSPFRDLTGVLQGDPRIGYSALDQLPRVPSPSIVPTLAKV